MGRPSEGVVGGGGKSGGGGRATLVVITFNLISSMEVSFLKALCEILFFFSKAIL